MWVFVVNTFSIGIRKLRKSKASAEACWSREYEEMGFQCLLLKFYGLKEITANSFYFLVHLSP